MSVKYDEIMSRYYAQGAMLTFRSLEAYINDLEGKRDELLQTLTEANIDRLQLVKDRDKWEQRARDLEQLCSDRL